MAYETIEYQRKEKGIGILSLNRPRRYNLINQKMMEELESFWSERQLDLDTHAQKKPPEQGGELRGVRGDIWG